MGVPHGNKGQTFDHKDYFSLCLWIGIEGSTVSIHYHCRVVGGRVRELHCVHSLPLYSVLWDRGWVGLVGWVRGLHCVCIHYHCTVYCGIGVGWVRELHCVHTLPLYSVLWDRGWVWLG